MQPRIRPRRISSKARPTKPSWTKARPTNQAWMATPARASRSRANRRTEKRMSDAYLKNVIEAALLAAARPVSVSELAQIFDEQSRPSTKQLRAALDQLAADYEGRGVTIRETANGFRFQVRSEFAGEVSRLWPERPR